MFVFSPPPPKKNGKHFRQSSDFKMFSLVLVGMIRLERTTPTSRTWCASQLRYIPIKNKLAYASLLMYIAMPLLRLDALFL